MGEVPTGVDALTMRPLELIHGDTWRQKKEWSWETTRCLDQMTKSIYPKRYMASRGHTNWGTLTKTAKKIFATGAGGSA